MKLTAAIHVFVGRYRASPRMIRRLWKLEMERIYKGYLGRE